MNEYTVSPEVLRSLKAGLPRRRPAFPKIKPWEERTLQGQGKTYGLGAGLPELATGPGRAFASDPWSAPLPTLQRLGE